MIDAYLRGDDLHARTARSMTGMQEITSHDRKLAKPVNFGLIYGLSAAGLRRDAKAKYGLDLSEEDAERYRRAFFRAYPAIKRWHDRLRNDTSTETRTLTGRRVRVKPDLFFGARANYAVQGTGGDGIKLALALLWERRHELPDVFPVLVVHDEIALEAPEAEAEAAKVWLVKAMVDALAPILDPVPVEVEAKVVQTWGG